MAKHAELKEIINGTGEIGAKIAYETEYLP